MKLRLFSIAALILVLLIAAVPAFAADPVPDKGNTDVVVVNTNQNTGSGAADVVALYYSPSGSLEYSRSQSVPARGSFAFLASGTPLGDNWIGSMILQSDQELAAVAEITWSGPSASAADKTTAGAYRGYAFGSTEMYLPFIVYAPNAQFSRISVQNTEDSPATIKLEYYNRDGSKDYECTDTVQGLGSKTYDTHVPGTCIPVWGSIPYFNTNGNWTGAVKVTSTNGREIVAVETNHWQQWAVAYNGSSSGADRNFIPSAERRVDTVQGWRGFSVIIAQCLESSSSCAVKIEFVNATTGSVDLTLNKTLTPGSALGANTRGGGDFGESTFEVLGGTWAGSVIVSTTNSTDISVIAYTIRPATTLAGSTSGANTAEAGSETFLPAIYQKNVDGVSCPSDPNNDWTQFSLIRIQNPTTTNATDVDIYFFNQDGTTALQQLNESVAAGKSLNLNTRNQCSTLTLGGSWSGSVYIKSNVPVVAVAETLWGALKMNAYNGYSVTR